jgi:hypothetical protein
MKTAISYNELQETATLAAAAYEEAEEAVRAEVAH